MQAHDKIFGKAQKYHPKGIRGVSVGSAAYMNRHEKAIPVDEAFLYKYFVETGRRTDGSGINGRKSGAEMEDLDSDEADEFLGDIDNHVSLLLPPRLLSTCRSRGTLQVELII
jgi:hypothetical protein